MPPLTDTLLDELRTQTDPIADEVVARHFAEEGTPPRELFRHLVERGGEAPRHGGAVEAFLAERRPLPGWLDGDGLATGAVFFERWGPQLFTALYAGSLPTAYAARRGVQVLALTARLETDTRRRLHETAQFLLDVTGPGALEPGRIGYQAARRVRLMHAGVRWLIRNDQRVGHTCDDEVWPRWCAEWGEPLNQEDLLGTLLTFTQTVFEVFEHTGTPYTTEEAEGYLHLWCVVGGLLGIREDLLPISLDEARTISEVIRRRQHGPSEAGQRMAEALLELTTDAVPRLLLGLAPTTMRVYVGDAIADMLDLPPADWTRLLFGPLASVTRWMPWTRSNDPLVGSISRRLGRRFLQAALSVSREGGRPRYEIPEHLARRWRLRGAPRRESSHGRSAAL